jgi:hypothetical protein
VSAEGTPTILYTGVRLRSSPTALPPPPPDQDAGLLWIETQCAAVPEDPDDELLVRWRKLPQAAVPLPPPGLNLTGWRDPFVYLRARSDAPSSGGSVEVAVAAGAGAATGTAAGSSTAAGEPGRPGYRMLLGSGVKGAGGALLVYSSSGPGGSSNSGSDAEPSSLAAGWRYTGPVCSVADLKAAAAAADEAAAASTSPAADGADPSSPTAAVLSPAAAAHELGEVWECPLLAQMPAPPSSSSSGGSGSNGGRGSGPAQPPWLLAVSPYPCKPPNVKSNPVLYWLGGMNLEATRQAAALRAGACSVLPPLSRPGGLCNGAAPANALASGSVNAVMQVLQAPADDALHLVPALVHHSAAGLTSLLPQAPSDWTWEMCCTHPMSAPQR